MTNINLLNEGERWFQEKDLMKNFNLRKGQRADNSNEPDPRGSDQQTLQIETEYRKTTKTDRTVGIDKLYFLPMFRQARPEFFSVI